MEVFKQSYPIKILETIRQGSFGGGESHLLSLAENLDRKKFEIIVLSFTEGPMIDKLNKLGIKTYVITSKKSFDFRIWNQVKKLIRKENISIIHAHGTRAVSNVYQSANSLKIPLIYTIHAWSFHELQNEFVKKLRILGEWFLTSRSTVNIAVSQSNQITGEKLIPGLKSIVIYNGIDLEKFNSERINIKLRSELGIGEKKTLVLFLARFEDQKQPLSLIRSFAIVSKKRSNLHLLMVGDGNLKPLAMKLSNELDLNGRITFQPFRSDVPDLLSISDIYVLPSLWEGMPIGLIEAMAMGKTIIATKVDGTKELIEHEITGWIVNKDKLEAELSLALESIEKNPELRNLLEINAKKAIKNNFDVKFMTKKVEEIYVSVFYQSKMKS